MMSIPKKTAKMCASVTYWLRLVEGSKGEVYEVSYSNIKTSPYSYGYQCTCAAYVFHRGGAPVGSQDRHCKHIKAVMHERCQYAVGIFKEEAKYGEFIDGKCPKCGNDSVDVEVYL